jgi:hypothetical protein
MDVSSFLITDAQSAKLIEPGERPLPRPSAIGLARCRVRVSRRNQRSSREPHIYVEPFEPEVSATAQGTQLSPGKANAAQKVLEARVGAEGIEAWSEQDAGVKSLFEAFFDPIHGLIGIS